MKEPQLRSVTCAHPGGLHRMAYWEWGAPDNPDVVVCVHGLTRSGRDFDALADRLAARYRVICPDIVGRGRSPWVSNPELYQVPQYVSDCVTLVARLDVPRVDWVGTSMGGLIGMLLASLDGNPIRRLVLNDVGPELGETALERIRNYVGANPSFASFEEGEAYVKQVAAGFGRHTDAQWRLLTRHYLVERDGAWRLHYDPAIAIPVRAGAKQPPVDLWPFYDRIECPTLLVRGAESDLLDDAVAQRMTERGPRAQRVDFADVGHAPTFIPDDQIAVVERFLQPIS
jgi:pimeloyl-ACP methyl ester carboxylesterase